MEALARALPPSLTALYLGSTCGVGCLLPLSVGGMRCGAGSHAVRDAEVGPCAMDRLGRATSARIGGLGSWLRVGCSRLAENRIGDAGVEVLARALPPSLTTLALGRTCGVGSLLSLSVGACAAVRGRNVVRGAG